MKPRIIAGVIGIPLLVAIILLPPIALTVAVSLISAVAVAELVTKTFTNNKSISVTSIIFAAIIPFLSLSGSLLPVVIAFFVFLLAIVCLQIYNYETQQIEQTSFAFFMSSVFPASMAFLVLLRNFNEHGLFYVLLAIIIAWMSDIGAYFIGTFFGKHKLCPQISPKKTVEGLLGGIAVSVIGSVIAGIVYQNFFVKETAEVVIWQIALLALVSAPLSVLGDLFASLIKRQHHVKDFGNIIPGHGGVMDRFDSLLLVVPFLYIVINFLPLIK
ncbi:MAG TPA: phosphatidate cytidylyltransferase [Clostridiales bacterium]|nr:phosphatidate cytidylyltransferase [Clostridiales bacterium]